MKKVLHILSNPWVLLALLVAIIAAMVWLRKKNVAGVNYTPPDEVTNIPVADYDVRPLVDAIYTKTKGANFFYYPELINILADLQEPYLIQAYNYWNQKYSGAMGGDSLTQALVNEFAGGYYDPAIARLTDAGLV